MTDMERYLKDHWYAQRSIGRLMLDLSLAKDAYQKSYDHIGLSCHYEQLGQRERRRLSPVERTAVIVVDQYRAELESIEKRLNEERRRIDMIERTVEHAGLDEQEKAYVRLRYFENKSVQAVAQRLYCSPATCGRLRERALKKIASVQKSH